MMSDAHVMEATNSVRELINYCNAMKEGLPKFEVRQDNTDFSSTGSPTYICSVSYLLKNLPGVKVICVYKSIFSSVRQ